MTDDSQSPSQDRPGHLLAVVLEDYFQVAPLKSVVQASRWHRFEARVEANTRHTLDLLGEFGLTATFFVLGWVAEQMPEVVAEVAARGHEVASKGYYHRSIQQLDVVEFREDLQRSREVLENAARQRVLGYRIAHGWLRPEDLWALDILAEEGFLYDSSIRPFLRSYSDQPWRRFPHRHETAAGMIWELPVSTFSLAGWSLPISGGTYLRQFPQWFARHAFRRWSRRYDKPINFYFHVWELDPEQPRIQAAPLLERIRQYRNLDRMEDIVRYYLSRYDFQSYRQYLDIPIEGIEPQNVPVAHPRPLPASRTPGSESLAATEPTLAPRQSVTVVVPCYNEELILPYLANTLKSVRTTLRQYELFFVFVDDGSIDGTTKMLREFFGERLDCRVVKHPRNLGVAAAIQTGLREATTEVVCSIDCDCSYDPHQLLEMIPLLDQGTDLVTASPYHPEGKVKNVGRARLFLSRNLSRLYRLVLGRSLATYTSCFRIYRRSAVIGLPLHEGGFLGVAEMLGLALLNGSEIREFPAVLEARLFGRSKMGILSSVAGHLRVLARLSLVQLVRGRGDRGRVEDVEPNPPPENRSA